MTANSSIDLTSADFFALKEDLKNFLRGQDQFKDYDYEGSNLGVVLDVMAYNATKLMFFYNMSFADGFLDSAQLRESVVSHAKDLNYCPRSARSAAANVTCTFQASGVSQPYIIPKGSTFSCLVKNESFFFSTPEPISVSSSNSTFTFSTQIKEGIYLQDSYVYKTSDIAPRFRITNKTVDTTSITVNVYEDGSVIPTTFIFKTSLLDLDDQDEVFFLQAAGNGFYEIVFGDGVIGRKPKDNSIVVIDYRTTNGAKANSARVFFADFDPTGTANETEGDIDVSTVSTAIGGEDAETIESIRYYAPRHFQAQERMVVPSDYEIALKQKFPEITAVSVYGGENHNPPLYGRVIVAIDIGTIEGIPPSKKVEYEKFIRARSAMRPFIIDPEFTFIAVDTLVRFNQNLTDKTTTAIKSVVETAITAYDQENFHDFDAVIRHSKLTRAIDDADPSIISNITDVRLYKKWNPSLNVLVDTELNFGIPLRGFGHIHLPHTKSLNVAIASSGFYYKGNLVELEDDGEGIVRIVRVDQTTRSEVIDVGTVDYDTGVVKMSNFVIDAYDGQAIIIYAFPTDQDVIFPNGVVTYIEGDQIRVTVETVRE